MARRYDPDKLPVCNRKYWQRPPSLNQGDASQNDIYQAVGEALSAWERMEEKVAFMFLSLCDPVSAAIRRAFGRVDSSSTRRNMILAAAESYFVADWEDSNVRVSFNRVLEAISWASKRRDDIAHGIAKSHKVDKTYYGWFLFPADYNTERTKPFVYSDYSEKDPLYFTFTNYRYTKADIAAFTKKFNELHQAVWDQASLLRKSADGTILFVKAVSDGK